MSPWGKCFLEGVPIAPNGEMDRDYMAKSYQWWARYGVDTRQYLDAVRIISRYGR